MVPIRQAWKIRLIELEAFWFGLQRVKLCFGSMEKLHRFLGQFET